MHKLGTLFGVDLLLDTTDEKIISAAGRYFAKMEEDRNAQMELRTKHEMETFVSSSHS